MSVLTAMSGANSNLAILLNYHYSVFKYFVNFAKFMKFMRKGKKKKGGKIAT